MTKNYLPSFREGKAIAAATILLKLSNGACDKYWLNKVLYFIERESLIRTGQPVFNDSLYSLPLGPIASTVNDEIDNTAYPSESEWKKHLSLEGITVRLIAEANTDILTDNEISLIHEAHAKFYGWGFSKMKDYFHMLPEHKQTKSRIDIEYIDILRPAGIDEESINDALETISYFSNLDKLIHCG